MRAILTYHSVDTSGSVISVAPETFEAHLRALASGSAAVVSLPELLRIPDDRNAIAITFDDAYTNFEREAWPRLHQHGFPVTLFVPTHFVGKANEWGELPGGSMPRLPILGWTALASLAEAGVTLGSHTRRHPDLTKIGSAAIEDEVLGASDDLASHTGVRPTTFSYPYGFWSAGAAAIVRRVCDYACTTELRPVNRNDDPHLLPRLDSFYLNGPARLEDFGSWTFREYLRLRLGMRTIARRLRGKSRA
jgi:peptidoglycan/xylan/chitin deacetylase (PgdA/CDA1 family)